MSPLTYFLKVRVDELQDSMLAAMAKKRKVSKSELVRQIIAEYAERAFRGEKS